MSLSQRIIAPLSRALGTRTAAAAAPLNSGKYVLPVDARAKFLRDGWAVLPNFLSLAELAPISSVYDEFMSGALYKRRGVDPKRDFCDMSQPFTTPFEQWQIVNAMLPRFYEPALVGNIYEQRAADVAAQLFTDTQMVLDYDQLLNKRPKTTKGIFAWHQDRCASLTYFILATTAR